MPMFSWRDIPILLTGWAIIFFVGLVLEASSLILHLVMYLVIALGIGAHYIWEEIAETGSFRLRKSRRRSSRSDSA